ncbi:hypothetical protein WJX74_003233 [Apatococcus lobatus]|uniref:Uncharacterized protein n=1 Tax=Apatococcus lobatus TaxID=904363 RepID=A0AAW1RD22_9CHLO
MIRVDVEINLSASEPDLRVNDGLDLSFEDEFILCTCRRTRKVVGRVANEQLKALQQSPTEAVIRTLKKAEGVATHAVIRLTCRPQPVPSAVLPVRIPEADEEALRVSSQLHNSHLQHLGASPEMQSILKDSRLQQTIRMIDTAPKPEVALSAAMRSPDFESFCNKVLQTLQVQAR